MRGVVVGMKEPKECMEQWFYTGHHMEDGVTPISVCARGRVRAAEYMAMGLKPVDAKKLGAGELRNIGASTAPAKRVK